jgi:hypothetical protein
MIKKTKMVPGKQDTFSRRMYVIRARPELIAHVKGIADDLETIDTSPTVVMTEEVPFEEEIEGWNITIAKKCKEAFLRSNFDVFPLTAMEKPEALLEDMDVLVAFFDKWWTSERVGNYLEIVRGSWKTHDCYAG